MVPLVTLNSWIITTSGHSAWKIRLPGPSYSWFEPLVVLAAMRDAVSSSRTCRTAWVTEPAVAGATGTSCSLMDSGPSAKASLTTSIIRLLDDAPETTSVVAQLKSAPQRAVPFVGPENRICTAALPE